MPGIWRDAEGGCQPLATFQNLVSPHLVTPSRHAPLSQAGDSHQGVLRGLSSIFLSPAATSQEPVSMAGKCDTIYKGFAGCLLSLGDSMAQSVRRQREEGSEEAQELDTICK